MKSLKFYLNQIGKPCGYVTCNGRGRVPAYSLEKGNRGLWVSCGRIHTSKREVA